MTSTTWKRAALAGAITAGLTALPADSSRATMSVGTYLLIETGRVEVDPDFTFVYVSGVLDALIVFNEAIRPTGISLFCPVDENNVIDDDTFKDLVDQAIIDAKEDRPDFEAFAESASIGVVGLGVLNETFPCAEGESEEPGDGT